ncbi:MAG: hypothetical protein VX498_03630, partial [Myxococcota bacterium]|nr:hypothetical protein [Myxococcota bacterium]
MQRSESKTLTPLVLVLGCWTLALALGIYHGPDLGADAERLHQLGEASPERSFVPILLSNLADATGVALVQAAVDTPKRALYRGDNR